MKIRYYGHNGLCTGYGRAADEMVEALAAAGAELEVRPLADPETWNRSVAVSRFFRTDDQLTRPDRIIIHTLPLSVAAATVLVSRTPDVAGVPMVGYTTWEALDVPAVIENALQEVDALWVPSHATLRAFDSLVGKRVDVVPHAYDDTCRYQTTDPRPVDAPFTFYYVGQWTIRKNPAGLVRAFCAEFDKRESVRLFLQCKDTPKLARVHAMFSTGLPEEEWPDVVLSSKTLSEPELWAIHQMADVFVSASHGEAWNLPAFEAMLAGRHIIAPREQGSDNFLRDTTAALYRSGQSAPAAADIRITHAPPGSPPGAINVQRTIADGLSCRCQWQEPDLGSLRAHMRHAFEARNRTLRVGYDVAAAFGRKAVGQRALQLLQEIKPR